MLEIVGCLRLRHKSPFQIVYLLHLYRNLHRALEFLNLLFYHVVWVFFSKLND